MASLAAFVAPVLLLVGFSMPFVDRLVFFPDRSMPKQPPAGAEDRWVETEDGLRIHAWYVAAESPDESTPTLVWAHGNGGNISGRYEVQAALARRGANVLAYDYRGYGKSEGRASEAGTYLDAHAVFDSLVGSGVPASNIVCLGESLGGAVTIELATQRRCAGVAVVSTFTTITDVARSHYGPIALLASGVFDSVSRVKHLSVPFLAVHGDQDDIVNFELGRTLFDQAPEPKEFLRIEGAGHNDIFLHPKVIDAIVLFAGDSVKLARAEPRE